VVAVLLAFVLGDPGYVALSASVEAGSVGNALGGMLSAIETVAYAKGFYGAMVVLAGWALALWPVQMAIAFSAWFLIDLRIRKVVWHVVDAHVLAAFIVALWTLPFSPPEEGGDPTLPAIALAIATAFGVRAVARFLPTVLDGIERMRFETLVAARMLRARKSGFLTVIGALSILAVSFSSCMLTTVLSVMGGFREDLQRKILGHYAHVVVDRDPGIWEGWGPVLERIRAVPGVQGASPYLAGEVMVTSASNLGGVVLHGIDPQSIEEVTELSRDMRRGRLEYLAEPERLLHLSLDEMSGSLLDDRRPSSDRPRPIPEPVLEPPPQPPSVEDLLRRPLRDEPTSPSQESFLREIDRLLGPLGPPASEASTGTGHGEVPDLPEGDLLPGTSSPLERPRDVLPGLIVGQELARSLRLHVGDEVNVVSPLGDLGPSGLLPRSRPFRIAGIFYSGMYEYDMKVVYTDLQTAQRLLSAGGAISGIQVKVDDWEHADRIALRIQEAIGRSDLRVRSWQEVHRNLFGALALEKLTMFITLGIAILVASFCIIGTLVLMIQEKGREIGILKAIGAHDRQIMLVFMIQGLFIGLLGAASGLGLGWLVCFTVEHYLGISLNSEVYYIDRLPVHIEPGEFGAVGIAAVIVCLLATIYPAIQGSRLRPIEALRDA
jgi:lipoprotein-releasing system permease protein